MLDGPNPVGRRQRTSLVVRDRDQRVLRPARVSLRQILQVQPAVKGGHGLVRHLLEEGKVDQIDVKVDDVEIVLPEMKLLHHRQMGGKVRFKRVRVKPDGLAAE